MCIYKNIGSYTLYDTLYYFNYIVYNVYQIEVYIYIYIYINIIYIYIYICLCDNKNKSVLIFI